MGILPAACFNFAITANRSFARAEDRPTFWLVAIALVMIEAPIATAPLTLYLGQTVFSRRAMPAQLARGFFSCLPQLFLLQFMLRALLIFPVFTCFIPYGLWPYLSEVILLERNPLLAGRGQISTLRRSSVLHRGDAGIFLLRALGALFLAPLLIVALWVSQNFVLQSLLGYDLGWTGKAVAAQVDLWLLVVYFTLARFLSYLDQRIRNEGWEVELLLRAERNRLASHAS